MYGIIREPNIRQWSCNCHNERVESKVHARRFKGGFRFYCFWCGKWQKKAQIDTIEQFELIYLSISTDGSRTISTGYGEKSPTRS
jgi:hypothetical protein